MRSLLPVTDPSSTDRPDPDTLEGLAEFYAYPERAGAEPWLRGNMVSSLDGAARLEGLSGGLSSPGDKRIFGLLRALCDAVVVGAETVRAEGYRPAKAREAFAAARAAKGQTPAPVIVVVSGRLLLDLSAPLFTEPLVRTVVVTVESAPAEARRAAEQVADVVNAGETRVDPRRMVELLAERGLTRLLCEGGPRLLAQCAESGVLDELCLSLAPLLTAGDAPRILTGEPMAARPMRLAGLLEEDGFLFSRYTRPL